jgi:ATP-dependent protease HslVU (ClpYQ) peptidase subunit
MTVIAWDGKTLAADRMMEMNGGKFPITKIRRLPDGTLIGSAGDTPRAMQIVEWIENGCVAGKLPAVQGDMYARALHIRSDGKAVLYANNDQPIIVEQPFMAIGSGQDYANTAMYLGHGARQAVAIASELCASCGMGIDALEL